MSSFIPSIRGVEIKELTSLTMSESNSSDSSQIPAQLQRCDSNYKYLTETVHTLPCVCTLYMYIVPVLDRTFPELPGIEKESSRKLEELEKRAHPHDLTPHTAHSCPVRYLYCTYIVHDITSNSMSGTIGAGFKLAQNF